VGGQVDGKVGGQVDGKVGGQVDGKVGGKVGGKGGRPKIQQHWAARLCQLGSLPPVAASRL
jgi:hypothetical protein